MLSARSLTKLAILCAVSCSDPAVDGTGSGTTGGGGTMSGTGGSSGGFFIPPGSYGGAAGSPGGSSGGPNLPVDENHCGYQNFKLERIPPELLLLFDRSSSMTAMVTGSANNRWVETVGALDEILMTTNDAVSWGLKMFPSTSGCTVNPGVEEPIASSNYVKVAGAIKAATPAEATLTGGTPTGAALRETLAYMRTLTSKNAKYVVLATDGEPTCPGGRAGAMAINEALSGVNELVLAGYKVFVVGIATAGTGQDMTLNQLAVIGGEARTTEMIKYYPVENRQDLLRVFSEITLRVASCVFPLDKKPPAPDSVAVNVSMQRIERDKMNKNGWNYGPNMESIVFYGAACDALKAGKVTNIEIIFGCAGMPVP